MESGIGSKKTTIVNLITMFGQGGVESITTGMLRGESQFNTKSNNKNDDDGDDDDFDEYDE